MRLNNRTLQMLGTEEVSEKEESARKFENCRES